MYRRTFRTFFQVRPNVNSPQSCSYGCRSFRSIIISAHGQFGPLPFRLSRLKSVIKIPIPMLLSLMILTGSNLSFQSQQIPSASKDVYMYSFFPQTISTGVNQKVLPVLSTETLLHIWLSTEYYGFRPSSTAVDTVS